MKKITSLVMLLLALTLSVNVMAQVRKTWDFSNLSQETYDNLVADIGNNWDSEGTNEDGTHKGFKSKGKLSGELTANGVVIKELQHITFGTSGLKGGDYILRQSQFRMTRSGMVINFPKMAPGQTLTIRARSANGTATNRGFTAGNDNLEYISGPKDGVCVGGQSAEIGTADYPVDEDGNFTLVWKVREDLGTTDSVDVSIKTAPDGGLDIVLFMIDEGDEGTIEESKKIAYLYADKEGYDVEADPIYGILSSTDNTLEAINITNFTAADTDTINALETNYDLLIVSETPASGHAFASSLKGMVNRVPMLNMKSFFYKSNVWGWGAGENPKPSTGTITLTEAGAAHPAFATLGYEAGSEIELYAVSDENYAGNIIQGYSISDGSYIAGDDTLATAGGFNAIHEHGRDNVYMLYPLSSDAVVAGLELSDDATNLLLAVVDYLAATKTKVRPANKPTIKQTYENNLTIVELSTSITGASIHYTVDGTEPTAASPVYTEPLQFTETAVIKAYVTCQGYNDSEVASAEIAIKSVLAAPSIEVTRNADNSVITLSGNPEGTTIYFNFVGGNDPAFSQAYTEPITLTEPATIYAFVSGGDFIDSDIVSKYVGIESLTPETIRLDTLTHFDANGTDWFLNDTENGGSGELKAYYFNGNSAWDYYNKEEIIGTEPVLGEDGTPLKTEDGLRDSVVNVYAPNPNALKAFYPLNENGWVIKSAGQVLTLEGTLDTQVGVGNGAANRYAEEAIDAVAGAPSKSCITFGGKVSGDPYTATIETTGKYAAPFDVVVMAGNGDGGAINMNIEVSADGTTWNKIADVKFAGTKRYWKRTRVAYNEAGEVYVRVAHVGGKTKAQVYDIFLFNNGENSKGYVDGVELPATTGAELIGVQIYNLSGAQINELGTGLNIVRQFYSDGTVKVLKVMGK